MNKKKTNARPKVMWAFWANTFGPSFLTPQKVTRQHGCDTWWHKGGDHEAAKIGLDDHGWICFAHPEKKRVQDFIAGFMTARKIMREFTND